MTCPSVLILGGNRYDILLGHLDTLAAWPEQLSVTILLLTDEALYNPQWPAQIALTYRHLCHLKKSYPPDTLSYPIQVVTTTLAALETQFELFQHCQHVLLTPEAFAIESGDLDLQLSDIQTHILEKIATLNLPLHEDWMQQTLSNLTPSFHPFDTAQALSAARMCAEAWLQIEQHDFTTAWTSPLGAQYRWLQDMQLWRYRLMAQDQEVLESAIHRVLNQPEDWNAHMVMLLYKRHFRPLPTYLTKAPPEFQSLYHHMRSTHGAYLEVLEPVKDPRISIVIPTYNRLSLLKKAVASVKQQTYPHWQLFIGEDGSTDGTAEYCQQLCQEDSRIRYTHIHTRIGPNNVIDRLYDQVDTELVVYLSDDDLLLPECLEKCWDFLTHRPWVSMVAGGYYYLKWNPLTQDLNTSQYGPFYPVATVADTQIEMQRCCFLNPIFGCGALYRKAVLQELGEYEVMYPDARYAYWDWLITWKSLAFYEVGMLPDILSVYIDRVNLQQGTRSKIWEKQFLWLAKQVCQDYWQLFGKHSYPNKAVAQLLLEEVTPRLVKAFHETLLHVSNTEELNAFVTEQALYWQDLIQLKQTVLARCEPCAEWLLQEQYKQGLTEGKVPGFNVSALPHELQWAIGVITM